MSGFGIISSNPTGPVINFQLPDLITANWSRLNREAVGAVVVEEGGKVDVVNAVSSAKRGSSESAA